MEKKTLWRSSNIKLKYVVKSQKLLPKWYYVYQTQLSHVLQELKVPLPLYYSLTTTNSPSVYYKVVWSNSLVVAEIYDLELLHITHLLWQRLQLVGMKEQHSGIFPITHLQGERTELC